MHHALLVLDRQHLETDQAEALDEVGHGLVQARELSVAHRGGFGLERRRQVRQVLHLGVEVEVEGERVVRGELVDLGQDVDVREVHLQHGAQGEEEVGHVERRLGEAEAVGEVDCY